MNWTGEGTMHWTEDGTWAEESFRLPAGMYRIEGQDNRYVFFVSPAGVGVRGSTGMSHHGGIYMGWGTPEDSFDGAGGYVHTQGAEIRRVLEYPRFFEMEGRTWRFASTGHPVDRAAPAAPNRR